MNTLVPGRPRFLVATIGGSPDPLIASLSHWRPVQTLFVVSRRTEPIVESVIVPGARARGVELVGSSWQCLLLDDEQDLTKCLGQLTAWSGQVDGWRCQFEMIVDYTGGTKTMCVALAMFASRWPCVFSYVGGSRRRKNDVGAVVTGTEFVIARTNPLVSSNGRMH